MSKSQAFCDLNTSGIGGKAGSGSGFSQLNAAANASWIDIGGCGRTRPTLEMLVRRDELRYSCLEAEIMYRKNNCLKWLVSKTVPPVAAILVFVSTSCHFSPTIYLDGGNPPRFHFAGRDYVEFFAVTEIAPENQKVAFADQDTDKNKIIWWIVPKDTSTANVRNFPQITYGILPPNFARKVPAEGNPPPLEEGKVYQAGGPAISLPKGYLWFTIRDGKPVQIPIR